MLMIRNVEVYAPERTGRRDVLICNEKIEWIEEHIENIPARCRVIEGEGLILTPGLVDQHVHVTGGGGEGSFHTRTPELTLSELIEGGVTTVMGLLGTDGLTRSVENLYAKVASLNEEGTSAYMLTGAYGYPSPTITGEDQKDILFIREVLGLKLAISDHRAPNLNLDELIQAASRTRVAGMLSGKPGIIVLHMGDAPSGLEPVFEALDKSAVPAGIFRPTHVNRNPALLEEGYRFLERGGYIDFTCGISEGRRPGDCILEAIKRHLPSDRITVSSDGHGSWSNYAADGSLLEIGVSGVDGLFRELQYMVQELDMPLEEALPFMTCNVARALGLYSKKGCIREGADADLLLLDSRMNLHTVIARGAVMMENGHLVKKGTYEK